MATAVEPKALRTTAVDMAEAAMLTALFPMRSAVRTFWGWSIHSPRTRPATAEAVPELPRLGLAEAGERGLGPREKEGSGDERDEDPDLPGRDRFR